MEKEMEFEILQELSGRYLKVHVEDLSENFGLEVLGYNEIEGVLGAQVHHVDEDNWYLYSIRDWISLAELFENNHLTAGQLSELLEQLWEIVKRCQEYFLEGKNLLLLCDYMFYEERNKKLIIPYLDGYQGEVADGISHLLERFMDTMNHSDKELVFLVYGLHRVSRDKHFSLNRLEDFLRENKKPQRDEKEIPRKEESREKVEESRGKEQVFLPTESQQRVARSNYGKALLFLVAGILVFFAVLKMGILNEPVSGEPDIKKVAVLVVVLVAAEGWILEKKLGRKEETKPEKEEDDKTMVLVSAYSDETVVLETAQNVIWYVNLVPEDWQRKEIKIRKSPFFIGKDAGKADGIIDEGEVSRVHAKIVADEDGVFLIDQESTNGTFVNGKRVVPWERYRLENGDIVGFSSVYYKAELYQ